MFKKEGDKNDPMLPKYTSTSRQWAGFKNPRIVRVSKAFGGKDRHSKVCTVKGLRDRRIRLSVPTAIQLYDLQDRLGLNQPSKVIDWLLDSTKDDIDQLPPLQMLPSGDNFSQLFHPMPPPALIQQDFNLNSPHQVSFSQFLSSNGTSTNTGTPNVAFVKDAGNKTLLYTKQGIKLSDMINGDHERKKGKEAVMENEDRNEGLNFFPIPKYSPTGLFQYNPNYYNWEPSSNLSISHFGNQGLVSSQTDNSSMSSMTSMTPSSASQFSPSPSPFTPYLMPNLGQNHDLFKQNNNSHFHLLSSSSQHAPANSLRPVLLNYLSDSQEKVPFGLDAHLKVIRSPKTNDR